MSHWSRKMAETLRKRSESKATEDAKLSESQKMKREVGPRLWDAVKSDIRAEGIALNADIGKELITEGRSTSSNEFVIVANLGSEAREARILMSIDEGKLTYVAGKGKHDSFEVYKGRDGKVAFYSGTVPYSTGSIATQILESLLD